MKRLRTYVVILSVGAALGTGRWAQAQAGGRGDGADPQAAALAELRSESKGPIKVRFDNAVPTFISLEVLAPTDASDPLERAIAFLERYRDLYQLADPRQDLHLERFVSNETGQHVFLGQHAGEVPIFGAQLAVHMTGNVVTGTNGRYLTSLPVRRESRLDDAAAEAAATRQLGTGARRIGKARLVYFAPGLFLSSAELEQAKLEKRPYQAWQVSIAQGEEARSWSYFVDAQSGAVLFRLPLFESQKTFDIATANNTMGQWFCTTGGWTSWFDAQGPLAGATPDAEGFGAFNATHATYDFFANTLHHLAWDGKDGPVRAVLDHAAVGGASFSYTCARMGFSNGMATTDVLAHEFTHGVVWTTAALISGNQPGALNESYADVFAAMVDTANWTMGEGAVSGVVRSLSDPASILTFDPTTQLTLPDPDDMAKFQVTTFDNGGVHINAGIPNKAAFLIAAGGTFNGITVIGIGRTMTAKLYYDVLTSLLTYNANFQSAADATVIMARAAAKTGRHGFTPKDACVVVNAFAAVRLGLPDLDCDGIDDATDSDDDGDTIGDSVDNCPRVANPGQIDTNGNGTGDACDNDDDGDGVVDSVDNCPLKANANQANKDYDERGDACDDSDLDGLLDTVDNCWSVSNPSQSDFDRDDVGDTCDVDDDNDGICEVAGPLPGSTPGMPAGGCPNRTDNCPRVANANQRDIDSDGYGDACDACPVADSGDDTDHDGTDNACDTDDDGDGIPDSTDNCPLLKNADQRDINQNGIGQACDPDEQLRVGGRPTQLSGVVQFVGERLDKLQIMVLPDLETFDCDWTRIPCELELHVQQGASLPVRVVDAAGRMVAQADPGQDVVLRFPLRPDFLSRPVLTGRAESGGTRPYQGAAYFLEILSPGRPDEGGGSEVVISARVLGNR